jgi:hypothetical protein
VLAQHPQQLGSAGMHQQRHIPRRPQRRKCAAQPQLQLRGVHSLRGVVSVAMVDGLPVHGDHGSAFSSQISPATDSVT